MLAINRRVLVVAATCLSLLPPRATGGEPVPLGTALDIIRQNESAQCASLMTASWTPHTVSGKVSGTSTSAVITPDPQNPKLYYRRSVTYEPSSGRYRMDVDSVTKWVDGDADTFAATETYTFDGRTERWYRRGQGGTVIPALPAPGFGTVKPETRNGFLDSHGFLSGVGSFPPNNFNRRLSEFLQDASAAKHAVTVTALADGTWLIDTRPPEAALAGDSDFRICYSPKGGLVQWAEWLGKPHLTTPWASKAWKRLSVQWQKLPSGLSVPGAVTTTNLLDQYATRITFSEVQAGVSADAAKFRIAFPIGTRLVDDVEKKSYTVSGGVVDEQEAVRQFMAAQALDDRNGSAGWGGWVYAVGTAALAGAAMILLRIRRRSLLVALIAASALVPSRLTAAEPDADGNWRVSHADGESIPVSQCGLNVTLFALEYFRQDYDVKRVSVALPPTDDGIRCADIKSALEAHGLEVVARDGVSLSGLKRSLRPGLLAIFPVKADGDRNHYLVAIEHGRLGRIVVDPPVQATPLAEGVTEEGFSSLGGLVLFVRKPRLPSPQNLRIAIAPADQDMGVFHAGTPENSKPLRRTFAIENRSDKAVMVSTVLSPCGCLQVNWPGGVVAAGETRVVPVTINPGGWGWGVRERSVTVVFGDGTQADAKFTGNSPQPEEDHQLSAATGIVRIDAPWGGDGGGIRRSVPVALGRADAGKVRVETPAEWLAAKLSPVTAETAELSLVVDPARLPGPPYPASADINLSTKDGVTPVIVRVIVSRPVWYTPDPAVLELRRGSEAQVTLRLGARGAPLATKAVSVIAAPPGVNVTRASAAGDAITLRVTAAADSPAGYHQLRCRFGAPEDQGEFTITARID